MLQFAALIINKGVAFSDIAMVFAAIVPVFLEIAIPMAALLGVMLAFARLSGDSEIIVIRASGISLFQLMKPVIALGLVLSILSLSVSIYLRPWGNYQLAQSFFEIAKNKSTAGLSPGIFNKLGKLTLYAEKIDDSTGALENILIDDKRSNDARKIILASKGSIISDPKDRTITLHLIEGHFHEEIEDNYLLTKFDSNNLVVNLDELYSNSDLNREKKSREMYLGEIHSEIGLYRTILEDFKNSGGQVANLSAENRALAEKEFFTNEGDVKRKIRRLKTEAGQRFSMPFATLILALLGMPLGIIPPRTQKTWGAGLSVALGLLIFTFYYVLLSVGITLGENGKVDVQLGLWIPNIVATIVTAVVLYKVSTEKWSSIAHAFELYLERILGCLRATKKR